jgi:type VI secretion system protein ImpH
MAAFRMYRSSSLKTDQFSLKELLLTRPYEFQFAQAMYLLEALWPQGSSLGQGTDAVREVVSLKSRVFFSAPPSDIFRIRKPLRPVMFPFSEISPGYRYVKPPWFEPPHQLLLTYRPYLSVRDLRSVGTPDLFSRGPLEMQVNFLGIAGIQGPLPMPYTETLVQRLRQKDF